MTDKTNVITKNDFEKYEILVPFLSATGKRKKQFLCQELEKRHPCFSDEFAFDSSLRSIKKKGVYEDVLVINKYKLAEYEGKRRFAGWGFLMPGQKNQHRYFMDAKWKVLKYLMIFISVFVMALLIFEMSSYVLRREGFISGDLVSGRGNAEQNELDMVSGAGGIEDVSESEVYFNSSDAVFFEVVNQSDGNIISFEWNMDGYSKRLSSIVKGVFPENFTSLPGVENYDRVVYENGVPRMTVTCRQKIIPLSDELSNKKKSVLENKDFNKLLRDTLSEYGAVLKEENAPPYHIEFTFQKGTKSEKLFEKLAAIITEDNRTVTAVNLSQSVVGEFRAGLSIEVISLEGFDLNLISKNLRLFFDDGIKATLVENNRVVKNIPVASLPYKKLGQIKKDDNTTVVYFKNQEGKMQTKILKENEEDF